MTWRYGHPEASGLFARQLAEPERVHEWIGSNGPCSRSECEGAWLHVSGESRPDLENRRRTS